MLRYFSNISIKLEGVFENIPSHSACVYYEKTKFHPASERQNFDSGISPEHQSIRWRKYFALPPTPPVYSSGARRQRHPPLLSVVGCFEYEAAYLFQGGTVPGGHPSTPLITSHKPSKYSSQVGNYWFLTWQQHGDLICFCWALM